VEDKGIVFPSSVHLVVGIPSAVGHITDVSTLVARSVVVETVAGIVTVDDIAVLAWVVDSGVGANVDGVSVTDVIGAFVRPGLVGFTL